MVFADLTPQQVLDSLDAVGLRGDGRILQLNSYENRVFQVFLEDGRAVVAKFYRPGRWSDAQILEEHGFALELAAAEIPVVPPLALADAGIAPGLVLQGEPQSLATLATLGGHRFAVAARCAGRGPELEDPDTLRQLGRFIGRLHMIGRQRPFLHRHHLDPRADGRRAMALLLEGGFVTPQELPAWRAVTQDALAAVAAAFESFPADAPLATLRLHGDCHPGNVLWREQAPGPRQVSAAPRGGPVGPAEPAPTRGSPNVVDLDDAMQGPAVQDLWMLVSGDANTMARQLNTLLAGYEDFADFDDRERRLIEPLRTLRMLRHAAWLAERWADPTFPLNFPFFGSAAYWSQQTTQMREQLEAMAG